MRVNADSLLIRAAATSTSGTLNDLTTDLIMANNNNNKTPRRCQSDYIPGLTDESKSLYEAYKKQYSIDHFGETTIDTRNTLINKMKGGSKRHSL